MKQCGYCVLSCADAHTHTHTSIHELLATLVAVVVGQNIQSMCICELTYTHSCVRADSWVLAYMLFDLHGIGCNYFGFGTPKVQTLCEHSGRLHPLTHH
jgi:hypothetical protein